MICKMEFRGYMQENRTHKQKLNYLDIARGIGIAVVILAHVDTGDNPMCSWIGDLLLCVGGIA